jgi:hypothetical protein
MVKRYPHTVVVKSSGSTIVDGAYKSGVGTEISINGRYEDVSGDTIVINQEGDHVPVKGKFFTKVKKIEEATSLVYEGVTFKIVRWTNLQLNSIIYLTT